MSGDHAISHIIVRSTAFEEGVGEGWLGDEWRAWRHGGKKALRTNDMPHPPLPRMVTKKSHVFLSHIIDCLREVTGYLSEGGISHSSIGATLVSNSFPRGW